MYTMLWVLGLIHGSVGSIHNSSWIFWVSTRDLKGHVYEGTVT